jgi:hypothetical protein
MENEEVHKMPQGRVYLRDSDVFIFIEVQRSGDKLEYLAQLVCGE